MLHGPKPTQRRAARLRREMTLPEVMLWRELRQRPAGLKFRRQHPAGRYVLDFFCAPAALAVEIDGFVHGCGDRPERDEARDEWLGKQGVRVLRILATDVLKDVGGVVHRIVVSACGQHPSTACGGPPPLVGRIKRFQFSYIARKCHHFPAL
jgi:very-short-patch-repair endonuclease